MINVNQLVSYGYVYSIDNEYYPYDGFLIKSFCSETAQNEEVTSIIMDDDDYYVEFKHFKQEDASNEFEVYRKLNL